MPERKAGADEATGHLAEFSERRGDGTVPYRIRGGDLATVEFDMLPGDTIYAEPGTFVAAHGGIEIDVEWGTSLLDPFKRVWSGESATLQEISCEGVAGKVVIGASLPGRIVPVRLDGTRSLFCDKGVYIAHSGDIKISVGFTSKVRAGLFGGNGFMMQRISGEGEVFLHCLGSVLRYNIPEGKSLKVNRRKLLAFTDDVGYDIQTAGGFWAMLFAGHGYFLARLEGPGHVICHSMDVAGFASALSLKGMKPKDLEGRLPSNRDKK